MQSRALRKTKSALHFNDESTLTCRLKRSPSPRRVMPRRVSHLVSNGRFACITRRTNGERERGALERIDFMLPESLRRRPGAFRLHLCLLLRVYSAKCEGFPSLSLCQSRPTRIWREVRAGACHLRRANFVSDLEHSGR